jgi:SAM-dependent methyltransferase
MIRSLTYFFARGLRRTAGLIEKLAGTQRIAVERTMSAHDMVSQPDEVYYRQQYWQFLLPLLDQYFPERRAQVLDVGCGQGRLALPLAEWLRSGKVTGIDITGAAIEKARSYSMQLGLSNAEFHQADAVNYLNSMPPESVDLALMLEVAFFMPAYREVIEAISRVLKRKGCFFVSFRSQYFDLLHSARKSDWTSARLVRDEREGHLGNGVAWFSWHTPDDIRRLLAQAGFEVKQLNGIGILSGIEGDPLSAIAQPSKLSAQDQDQLMEIETSLAEEYAECGRYILAIAVKE